MRTCGFSPSRLQARFRRGARRRLRRLSGEGGFSFVDVSVAIGLFALIAALTSQMLTAGMTGALLGKRRATATQEANRMLEIARSLSYDAIGLSSADPTIDTDPLIQTQAGEKRYLVDTTWEPVIFAGSAHPDFVPHIQDLERGASQLSRAIYVTGVDRDFDGDFDLKRVTIIVFWSETGTPGPENSVRAQTLVDESGLVPTGASSTPLTGSTFASGGSITIDSSLLGLSAPLNIALPNSTGDSVFRAVSNVTCSTRSAGLQALNIVDLPGYPVSVTADDDTRTPTPADPPPQSNGGVLAIPGGAVSNLLGPVVNSPVSCEASATGSATEDGEASAVGVLTASDNVIALGGLLNWLLTVATLDVQPVTQSIEHQVVNDAREVLATANSSVTSLKLLTLPSISDGLVRIDTLGATAAVRGSEGTPSAAPSISAPAFSVRVFDNGNKLGGACTSRSGSYCVIAVDPTAAGFAGQTLSVTHNFTQLLGLNLVSLAYTTNIQILAPSTSPAAGEAGPNGETRWVAEYSPMLVSANLNASVLGIDIIDATVDLDLGTVHAEACAGATCI